MKRLTTYHIKLIATVLMVLDHIGYFLVPSNPLLCAVLRSFGRLSAPLFWYCFSIGFTHTSNKMRYLRRLGICAVIMAVGNLALNHGSGKLINLSFQSPNIFLTFFATGLLILLLERLYQKPALPYLIVGICAAVCLAFLIFRYAEYGRYALACILPFYFIKDEKLKFGVAIALCALLCAWVGIRTGNWRQIWMLASFLIMWLCGTEKPKRGNKYFFYIFYPTHLWIMTLIGLLIRLQL